jgi:hypothetical protein
MAMSDRAIALLVATWGLTDDRFATRVWLRRPAGETGLTRTGLRVDDGLSAELFGRVGDGLEAQ